MKPGDLRFSHKVGVTFGHERRSDGLSQTCLISGPIILLQFGAGVQRKTTTQSSTRCGKC